MSSKTAPASGTKALEQQRSAQCPPVSDKSEISVDANANNENTTSKAEDSAPVVRMRTKAPNSQIRHQASSNGNSNVTSGMAANVELNGSNGATDPRLVLQRGLEVLNEVSAEDDGSEEIRKLDSQLDHLNHYMDTVEQRIKVHNEKLMDTLKQQREERERRRRSFHERVAQSQREDNDFQQRLSTLLNRVDISKNRASMYDIISQMEVPKTDTE